MSADPVLVLQMQRMGDLLLSFPLLLWLRRCYPAHPLHVVAEPSFSEPLLPASPPAAYISWADAAAGALLGQRYRLVANLSIREEAARLAGSLEAEALVGPARGADGALRVHGAWQLYRTALVGQNRLNRFHWADLNALDMIPLSATRETHFAPPREPEDGCRAVGVFVGASEPGKRPDAVFYAELVRELLDRGLVPVLLGGEADLPVSREIRALFDHPAVDLVGRLSLAELAAIGNTLGLFITPDTGPMHLAAWSGLRTLNLSVGHVNPWETGPYQPGHLVLRSSASCARGCWTCRQKRALCREALSPRRVAALAVLALRGQRERLGRLSMPGLRLFETARSEAGLFDMRPLGLEPAGPDAEALGGEFWRRYFLWRLSGEPEAQARAAWEALAAAWPRLAASLKASLPALGREFARLAPGGSPGALGRAVAPFWRPLAGYLEVLAENADASRSASLAGLGHVEALASLL